jgi:hypothetical protein
MGKIILGFVLNTEIWGFLSVAVRAFAFGGIGMGKRRFKM